jgi:actin-related protein
MVDASELSAVVIDNGSGSIKVGISGDDCPRALFPTVVGKPKIPGIFVGMDQKDTYVGMEANIKVKDLNLSYPVQRGLITDWNDMEKIWHHCYFTEMRIPPEDNPVFMTEPSLNPRKSREEMIKRMFEVFQVHSFYVATQAVLALYSSGRMTGIVLDSGEGQTTAVPVYEGYPLPHAITRNELAGSDLTAHLLHSLKEKGVNLGEKPMELAKEIKESVCYVAENYETAKGGEASEGVFELPDKTKVSVGSACYEVPEIMFDPSKGRSALLGAVHLLHESVSKCDEDIRKEFYGNIVLSGGNTLMRGFTERLTQGVGALAGDAAVNVYAAPERKYAVWIGASILSSLRSFESMWITKADYEAEGEQIVHRRCF